MRSDYERFVDDGYHSIDSRLFAQLLPHFDFKGLRVWEPAAGDGHLCRALQLAGAHIVATGDLRTGQDFLALQPAPSARIEAIVTNPPYGDPAIREGRNSALLIRFIEHALDVLPEGWVFMLTPWSLPACMGERDGRRVLLDHPRRFALTEPRFRGRWIPGTTGSPRFAHCWNVWAPQGFDHDGPYLWRS